MHQCITIDLRMGLRNLLCIFVVVLLAQSFTIVSPQSGIRYQDSGKIPEYIGLGYNVLKGNPYTNHIDQGFRSSIFKMKYDNGQRTEDNKYLIPDFTHSTQTISCSLQSRVSEFTGTENYQKELGRITKFDSRLSYDFLKAAFSYSRTFEEFSNSTQTHKQTSVQSNAECTVYTIDMPIYSNEIPLSLDFIGGVREAIIEDDWNDFIDHFGTHFASAVTFGGRYFLEHTYSEQAMSLFTSMNLDVKYAAEVQFYEKLELNLTDDMKRYQNQTSVINTKVDTSRLSTLGGLPPRSGDFHDWVDTVKENLAPVSYQLTTISVLFNFVPNINVSDAVKSYTTYLNTYCQRNRCPPLTPQRPDPKPLAVSFTKTGEIVGPQKSDRTYDTNDGKIGVGMRVAKVLMGVYGNIDAIQFFLKDGITQHYLPIIGNQQTPTVYQVPEADEIKCIRFGISYEGNLWHPASMQFVTRKGVESQVYAGTHPVNQYQSLCVGSNDEHFVGFYGRFGSTIDSIGFNMIKETMQ